MKTVFSVFGEPQGKGRPRFSRIANGRTITRTPDKTVLYENLVITEYRRQTGDKRFDARAQLSISLVAYYGIPKSASKRVKAAMESGALRPIKTPDTDNILKIVCDSLNGVAYRDDAQIVDSRVQKFYSAIPRVDIVIEDI